ncbi:MAG: sulfotransferase family protein [Cyclobacteriaceae bacterium]
MKDSVKRICLWSGPRNISTALMYSFAQRHDTTVYDEPLYGYYLQHLPPAREYHPGADEVINTMETDGQKVVDMMMGEHHTPVVFFKHMTHHLLGLDRSFMKDVVNVILTRDPVEMLPSYGKLVTDPTMQDVGYAAHMQLLDDLHNMNVEPIVVDSKKILLDPEGTLTRLCELAGIPFDKNMLHWQAGARPEEGVWARYWYSNVRQSTGFAPYAPKTGPFPERLKPLLKDCLPHYHKLREMSIG